MGQLCLYVVNPFESLVYLAEPLSYQFEFLIHGVEAFVHTSKHLGEISKHPTADSNQQNRRSDDDRNAIWPTAGHIALHTCTASGG